MKLTPEKPGDSAKSKKISKPKKASKAPLKNAVAKKVVKRVPAKKKPSKVPVKKDAKASASKLTRAPKAPKVILSEGPTAPFTEGSKVQPPVQLNTPSAPKPTGEVTSRPIEQGERQPSSNQSRPIFKQRNNQRHSQGHSHHRGGPSNRPNNGRPPFRSGSSNYSGSKWAPRPGASSGKNFGQPHRSGPSGHPGSSRPQGPPSSGGKHFGAPKKYYGTSNRTGSSNYSVPNRPQGSGPSPPRTFDPANRPGSSALPDSSRPPGSGSSGGRRFGPSKPRFGSPGGGPGGSARPNNFSRPPMGRPGENRPPMGPRPDNQVFISPSRLEAAKALYSLEKGAKVSDVLELKRNMIPADEALMRELVYGCTRQKRLLDHYLGSLCQTPFEKLPVEVKISLRLGLYQLLFLDRVPAHAAVHESVNLAKKGGQAGLSGFVNAVLRNAEAKKATLAVKGDSEIDTLALKFSHPTWLVKKWAERLDPIKLEKVLKANNQPHPVYLHVKPGFEPKVEEDLQKQNVRVSKEAWPPGALRLRSHEGGLFSGESFQQGDWIVQDWVPQAMLEMLPLEEGQRVWDVCSAPGGKTVALAWELGEKGQVLASDASSERRKRLVENLKRVGLNQVMVFDGEVKKLPPQQKFELIWVDAPCSGTGVLSRRADLRWRLIPKNILEQIQQQKDLLEQTYNHLYPKGSLVYTTCSLEKEENQQVVQSFLRDHPDYQVLKMAVPEGHPEISVDEEGMIFWPTADHDGGFMAVIQKK